MTNKLSIAIAAGLLLAGPVFADDKDQTRTQDQQETKDQIKDKDSAGIGSQVRELARTQAKGEDATGIGEQVREQARTQARDRDGELVRHLWSPLEVAAPCGSMGG
jgi:hypothetical protein